MPNLDIDDRLLTKAARLGHTPNKKAAVVEALQEYIARREQMRITDLFGKIDFDPAYDYKKQRKRA